MTRSTVARSKRAFEQEVTVLVPAPRLLGADAAVGAGRRGPLEPGVARVRSNVHGRDPTGPAAGRYHRGAFDVEAVPPASHRPLDHTADAGVEIDAPSREALFAEAAIALADMLTPIEGVGSAIERVLELEAANDELLLVDFLNEILFLFETEGLVFAARGGAARRRRRGVVAGADARGAAGRRVR